MGGGKGGKEKEKARPEGEKGRAYTAEKIKLLGFDPSASGVAGGEAAGRAAMVCFSAYPFLLSD